MGHGHWRPTSATNLTDQRALTAMQLGGRIHQMIVASSREERHELLAWLGNDEIRRIGHKHHLADLRDAIDDDSLIEAAEILLEGSTAGLPRRVIADMFLSRLAIVLDEGVDLLGERHSFPSADDLEAMGEALAERHPVLAIRTLLAVVVECRMPARPSVLELDGRGSRYAPRLDATAAPKPDPIQAAPREPATEETRTARRTLHQAKRDERQLRNGQTKANAAQRSVWRRRRRAEAGECSASAPQGTTLVQLATPAELGLSLRRLEHPKFEWPGCHSEIDLVADPVGRVGVAYIRWGKDLRYGKFRPVIVIGADTKFAWVRGVHTLDLAAGRWRSMLLRNWRELGLDHESFVAVDVHRVKRSKIDLHAGRLSDHDWNRLCRGEVH